MNNIYTKQVVFAFLILVSFLNTGCSVMSTDGSKYKSFQDYNNVNHVVGNKSDAIKTLVYTEEVDNKVNKKIIFYIDRIPYKKEFDLCLDQKGWNVPYLRDTYLVS